MVKEYLTIEEILSIPRFSNVVIDNTGQRIAFEKRITNWEDNSYLKQIWVYDIKQDELTPLNGGQKEGDSPTWSPDGRYLAYLAEAGEDKKRQVFITDQQGKEIQFTHSQESVSKYKWSKDGKGIFYLAVESESEEMEKRKKIYGDFEYVDQEYRNNKIYYLDLETGLKLTDKKRDLPEDLRESDEDPVEELTTGDYHIITFEPSPDGKQIALIGALSPDLKDWEDAKLYIIDTDSRESEVVIEENLFPGSLLFSPDGDKICYMTEENWYDNRTLEILNLDTHEKEYLIKDIDENISPLQWTRAGILFRWQRKTQSVVALVDENGDLKELIGGQELDISSASLSEDGQRLAYIKETDKVPGEIYLNDSRITDNYLNLDNKIISRKEVISWKSSDGVEIEGVLSTPIDFDPEKSYPLAVVVHGGPVTTSIPIVISCSLYPIEQFVEKGFIVLEPNYRGSAGYGEEFRKLNYRNLGLGDYQDVISGVDYLIEKGWVDEEKVGVMGWSQGGFISAFCTTYGNRFKAASVGAGISNWITYYTNTDIHQFTRDYLGDTPWNDREIYEKTSPVSYINSSCDTPTLIQHGDSDTRVPVPNAYELYQGLKDVDVETDLVIFKGMGHGPYKPGLRRAIMTQNLIWFSHHILGEEKENFYLK